MLRVVSCVHAAVALAVRMTKQPRGALGECRGQPKCMRALTVGLRWWWGWCCSEIWWQPTRDFRHETYPACLRVYDTLGPRTESTGQVDPLGGASGVPVKREHDRCFQYDMLRCRFCAQAEQVASLLSALGRHPPARRCLYALSPRVGAESIASVPPAPPMTHAGRACAFFGDCVQTVAGARGGVLVRCRLDPDVGGQSRDHCAGQTARQCPPSPRVSAARVRPACLPCARLRHQAPGHYHMPVYKAPGTCLSTGPAPYACVCLCMRRASHACLRGAHEMACTGRRQ